ncbi:MAG TPA: hypothetical protein VF814_19055 [Casimicrobiaceae bacterium]
MNSIVTLCGTVLMVGCAAVPVQKVERTTQCDYALMERIDSMWQPPVTQRYWVNCPQVRPDARKS